MRAPPGPRHSRIHPRRPGPTTAGTAAAPARSRRPRAESRLRSRRPRAGDGLITLEWLLIVGAIAGLAASSVLIVQRVVDETAEAPEEPRVRLLEADIAAALVAGEANQAVLVLSPGYVDTTFASRCQDLENDFDDVVSGAPGWSTPSTIVVDGDDVLDKPARCTVTPKPNLGGS